MKLTKTVFNNIELSNTIDRSFKEVKKEPDKVSISKFFEQYRILFFDIPNVGTESHQTLIDNSTEKIGIPGSTKDDELNRLNNKIIELETELANLSLNNDLTSLNQSLNEQTNLTNG